MSMSVITATSLPGIDLVTRGKVRDVYSIGNDLLIVATDRISAFDCILPQGIPGKGRVLTQMSLFWFDFLRDLVPNHLITAEVNDYTAPLINYRDRLEGRSMLVKRCRMEPIECVARGYVSGSGWKDYRTTGAICGIKLPAGCVKAIAFPNPYSLPHRKPKPATTKTSPSKPPSKPWAKRRQSCFAIDSAYICRGRHPRRIARHHPRRH